MTFTTRALGLGVCLAVTLSACGGSTGSAAPSAAASSPAAATSTAAAAPAAGSTVTGKDLADRLGTAMAATPNTTLTLKVTGGDGAEGTGSVSFAAAGSSQLLKIQQKGGTGDPVTMLQTSDAIYIDAATAGADGKKWVRIKEISDKGGMFTALFGVLAIGTTSFSNPDGLLRVVAATPSLTVKTADAQGVTYTASVQAGAAAQLFPAQLFGGDEKARNEMAKQSTGETMALTVVTDAQGRPTEVSYGVTDGGEKATVTSGYTGWGSGEAVPAPDPATVIDAAELEKQLTS